jgi:hypothetical protein
MNIQQLEAFARGLGALPSAVEDVVARGHHQFGETTPQAEALEAWGTTLKRDAPHLFRPLPAPDPAAQLGIPAELWAKMSPADRSARWRATLPPVVRTRPYEQPPVTLTLEQHKELAGLAPMARLARYRELQAQAPPPRP